MQRFAYLLVTAALAFSHFHKARLFRWTIFFSIWEKQTFLLSNFFATFKNSVLPKIRVVGNTQILVLCCRSNNPHFSFLLLVVPHLSRLRVWGVECHK